MDKLYREYQISAPLQPYLDCIWKEGYEKYSQEEELPFLVVPDNTVELVFTRNNVKRKQTESKEYQHNVKSHISGLKTQPQHVKICGDVLISVRFKPYGLYPFTDVDLGETIDGTIEPSQLFGRDILYLEEELFESKGITEKIRLIEKFFIHKLVKGKRDIDAVFDFCVHEIVRSKGSVGIADLANRFNVSIKTIERKFKAKLGVSPKKYSRIVRLFHSLKIPKESTNLTWVALDNGFYDQAHFIKEVKQFTGMTPKEYFSIDRTIQTNIFLS